MNRLFQYLAAFIYDIKKCHRYSSYNRGDMFDTSCGCFYCLSIFPSTQIKEWIDNGETAKCPHCGIDSVIGAVSGFPITIPFLKRMRDYWFGTIEKVGREKDRDKNRILHKMSTTFDSVYLSDDFDVPKD